MNSQLLNCTEFHQFGFPDGRELLVRYVKLLVSLLHVTISLGISIYIYTLLTFRNYRRKRAFFIIFSQCFSAAEDTNSFMWYIFHEWIITLFLFLIKVLMRGLNLLEQCQFRSYFTLYSF